MSLRELRVLVTHLPPDCATARKIRGTHWGEVEYLLADLADSVRFHRAEWAMSKGAKPPKPKPVPRPKPRERPDHPVVDHKVIARAAHEHVLAHVLPPRDEPSAAP